MADWAKVETVALAMLDVFGARSTAIAHRQGVHAAGDQRLLWLRVAALIREIPPTRLEAAAVP